MKRPGERDDSRVVLRSLHWDVPGAASRVGRAFSAWRAAIGPAVRSGVVAAAVGAAFCSATPALAVEPFEAFLTGLDNRGLYEEIAWYLDQQSKNPDLPTTLKASIPYQQGYYLLEWAKNIKDTKVRFEKLDQAAAKLSEFVKANPSDDRASLANLNLGNVLVERAKAKIADSERPNNAANKDKLLGEARDFFKQATSAIDDAVKKMDEKLKSFPAAIDKEKEPQKFKQRDEARGQFLVARDVQAKVRQAASQAHPAGSKERVELLKEAVKYFKENADRFYKFALGDMSKVQQAACLYEIGGADSRKQALALLDTVTAVEQEDPTMRELQAEAVQVSMQILTHPEEKKADQAAKRGEEFLAKARGAEDREDAWQGVRWQLVAAKRQMLAAAADDAAKKKITRDVVAAAQQIAKTPNQWRDDARKLLADPAFGGAALGPPTDFAGAWENASSEYGAMLQFMEELKTAKDDKAAEEIKDRIAAAQEKAADAARLAIVLRNAGQEPASVDAVVKAHYLICTIYLLQSDFARAAVMADYITSRYPNSADARPAAECALRAYHRLFITAQGDRTFEGQKLEAAAKYILDKYPAEDSANEARLSMLAVYLAREEYAKLPELLKQVPETSASRADMELQVGAADWKRYLQLSRLPEESRPSQQELDAIAQQAEKLLVAGVNRASKNQDAGNVGQTYLRGQASLAQLYSRSAKHKEALAVLEAKPNGVLTLLEAKNPTATAMTGLDKSVYAVALQSYVTTKNQARAEAMMKGLEEAVKSSGQQAQQNLTGIYMRLGRELEEDLKRLAAERKNEEYRSTLESAKVFLKKIAERGDQNTYATTNWVAGTFYNLGRAAKEEGSVNDAKALFGEASSTYEVMLKKSADWWPDAAKANVYRNAVRIRQAECLRETENFEKAVEQLETILRESPNNLDAQKAIAETYQTWGVVKKEPDKLNVAMAGQKDKRDAKKTLVWGWNYMARSMQKHALDTVPSPEDPAQTQPAPFAETFFEARYNLSKALFQASKVEAKNQKKHLASAAKGIVFVAQQYPKLGGPVMYGQFDALLKQIQRDQGEKPIGLADIAKVVTVASAENPLPEGTATDAAAAAPKSTGPKKKEAKEEPTNPVVYVAAVGVALFLGGLYFLMNMQKKKYPAPAAKAPEKPAAAK